MPPTPSGGNRVKIGGTTLGIWDKPVTFDGEIKDLVGYTFMVVAASLREVDTVWGTKPAVDLTVDIDGETFCYSGFSAGIVAQVKNSVPEDFPLVARIESVKVKNGNTLQLVPSQDARDLPKPVSEEELPATDDDIPF